MPIIDIKCPAANGSPNLASPGRRWAGAVLVASLVCTAGPLQAEEAKDLEALEQSISKDREKAKDLSEKTQALEDEIRSLQVSFTGTLSKIRRHEQAIASAEETLTSLESERQTRLDELTKRRRDFYGTLAAMQRIAFRPRAAMLASEHPPVDTLRGALLLGAALPEVEAKARTVEDFLSELQDLTRSIEEEHEALDAAAATLRQERLRLRDLIERKQAALSVTETEKQAAEARAAELADKAETLRQLMALATEGTETREAPATNEQTASLGAVEATKSVEPSPAERTASALTAPSPVRFLTEQKAQLLMPIHGRIVARFGQTIARGPDAGRPAKGLTIRAESSAQVVAPFDGKVVYAGVFRTYGQILIIDHGGRYHTLLAGLDEISAAVGQWVLAGEPIATISRLDDQQPELYLELRRTGEAIDPMPWLADIDSKVRG